MCKVRSSGLVYVILTMLFLLAGCSDPKVNEEEDVISMHGLTVKNVANLDAFIEKSRETQRVVHYTIEGDPIFYVLKHQGNLIEMKYDTTQDEYGTRKVSKFTCDKLQKNEADTFQEYKLIGCSGTNDEVQILEIPYDVKQMNTFEFVLKYGVHLGNKINTFDGVLVKDLQNGETAEVSDFQFTPEERQTIYKNMVLANYSEEKELTTSCNMKPHQAYDLTIYANNRVLQYEWSECDKSKDGQEMTSLINEIIDIVKAKDIYKQLPPAKGGYQ